MRRSHTTRLAWGLWSLTIAMFAIAIAFQELAAGESATQAESTATTALLLAAFVGFATVGALVGSRQPRNAVGWIFLAIGALVAVGLAGGEYANYTFVHNPGALPGGHVAGWFFLWTWIPAIGLIALLPLLFPDGRAPGPRWRLAVSAVTATVGIFTILTWVDPGPLNGEDEPAWPDNPIGIEGSQAVFDTLGDPVLLAVLATSLAATVVRFRRSRGDERQQLKWMTWAVGVMAVAVALSISPWFVGALGDLVFAASIALLPGATAVAMLKYRLYEIDRVISRTLVYGALTVILGAAYVGLVLAGQAVFSSFAGGSNLAIAGSTLVVAALFLPARARVQRFVDRRFYRRRYDAQRTLEAFGARLREEIDLDALATELRSAVVETMQPAHASLWLRGGGRA